MTSKIIDYLHSSEDKSYITPSIGEKLEWGAALYMNPNNVLQIDSKLPTTIPMLVRMLTFINI